MAKAKEIVGLDCATNVLEWTRAVLIVRFGEIVELRDAALDFADVEGVHDMRVATRRLRSAVRDFLPFVEKSALKKARRELQIIADALGVVRDEDVAILALEKLAAEAESDQIKQGIETLLTERKTNRNFARTNLTEAIAAETLISLQTNFTDSLEKAIAGKNKKSVHHQLSFGQAGKTVVEEGLSRFLDLSPSLYNPFEIEPLHKLRIAAKRLRYALELFVVCFGEDLRPFAEQVAEMQGFLGEVHDADVWIADLGKRLQKADSVNNKEFGAALWLLSKFVKTRTANYRAALELWNQWQANSFAERMRISIR